jgi:phosphate transport system substrate-binding protein
VKRSNLPRALVVGALSLTVAVGLSACGASNENNSSSGGSTTGASLSGTLNGAGSSAQQAAMDAWKAAFQSANPDVTVNYDPSGSSAGREQLISGGVQFAGSDAYLTTDELSQAQKTCGGSAIEYPVYVSPIALVYNIPGVDKLQLDPKTIAGIFAGKITQWDDAAIKADNPGMSLSGAITPVHRSDGSGTTDNFTDYLSQTEPSVWTYGMVDEWPIKGGEGAEGTSGVIAAVTNGKGTIGYADASQAGSLGVATVKVGSAFVAPSAAAASKVLEESKPATGGVSSSDDIAIQVNRTSTTAGVYPIILVSYQMICSTYKDQATVDLVKGFASYVISADGQNAAAQAAGSAPITDSLRQQAQAAIDTVAVQ